MEKYGVQIHWTSRYDYYPYAQLNLHAHDFFQIIYFIDGKGTFSLDGSSYSITPGVFFFIAPTIKHGFVPMGKSVCRTLDLKFHIQQKELQEAAKEIHGYQTDPSLDVKRQLVIIRSEGLDRKDYYGQMASIALLHILYSLLRTKKEHALLKQIVQIGTEQDEEDPWLAAKRMKHYMQENFAEELTLDLIAEQLSYSRSYLSRCFKIKYGCSYTSYLRRIRIEKAKELMAYSTSSLKQVSEMVGYKTIHHFSRVFKEVEGVNPGKWKKTEINGIRKDVLFN